MIEGPISMASASDCTRTPSSGHPPPQAVAVAEEKNYVAAIERMLSGEDAARHPLSALSIGGLYSLFQAHDAASLAFMHEANTPCAVDDAASSKLLDEFADHHHRGQEAVIAEMERRRPNDGSDRAMRFKLLAAWYADDENWLAVARLAAEADAAARSDSQEA